MQLIDVRIPLRWRDLDAYDHVNNGQFLTFIEEARIQWFASLDGSWRSAVAEPVLAAANVNFRRSIGYPAVLRVLLTCARVGTTSLTVDHRMIDAEDEDILYSDGHSVIVWVSPVTGRPVRLPDVVRQAATGANVPT